MTARAQRQVSGLPDTPAAQAAYMTALARHLDTLDRAHPPSIELLTDLCHAVAVIGAAAATAQAAYVAGLKDGKAAAVAAVRIARGAP